MQSRFLLNIVIIECPPVLELFARKDHSHLVSLDTTLSLHFCFDVLDQVARLHIDRPRDARLALHKDLHAALKREYQLDC
jgi:hypothetical protein